MFLKKNPGDEVRTSSRYYLKIGRHYVQLRRLLFCLAMLAAFAYLLTHPPGEMLMPVK